jgi:hypothetical protein
MIHGRLHANGGTWLVRNRCLFCGASLACKAGLTSTDLIPSNEGDETNQMHRASTWIQSLVVIQFRNDNLLLDAYIGPGPHMLHTSTPWPPVVSQML